ncbi:MAG: GNAT family N-acetyltransferase [Marmoricola sp.]
MATSDSEDQVILRPGAPEDAEQLRVIYTAATEALPWHPDEHRSDDEVREWLATWPAEAGFETWVAESNGETLGFATLRGDWLMLLFVHPHRHAPGVGAALLDLVKATRPDGFGLRVFEANARARDFYRRHGLVELEHTDGSAYPDELPDLRMAWMGENPLAYLRRCIDDVDAELAVLLARRFAYTAQVQAHKDRHGSGGHAGRDRDRERAIVERMSRHAPGLGPERLSPIMDTVIRESLTAWENTTR